MQCSPKVGEIDYPAQMLEKRNPKLWGKGLVGFLLCWLTLATPAFAGTIAIVNSTIVDPSKAKPEFNASVLIADETKKQHLTFAGHVPLVMSWVEASNAGMHSIEHIQTIFENLEPDPSKLVGKFPELLKGSRDRKATPSGRRWSGTARGSIRPWSPMRTRSTPRAPRWESFAAPPSPA
jgi:hypothetical protein